MAKTKEDYGYKVNGTAGCPHCQNAGGTNKLIQDCVLNKPLLMVIPPGGTHLSCPSHPEGHHVFGPQVTY